jgi:hypothetical protein
VATFAALGLWVKTLDLVVSTTAACASLPSWGHCRGAPILLGLVSVALVASLGSSCLYLFIFDLLCKRFSSSPYIGLVCGFIYKVGRKPISRNNGHNCLQILFKLVNMIFIFYIKLMS